VCEPRIVLLGLQQLIKRFKTQLVLLWVLSGLLYRRNNSLSTRLIVEFLCRFAHREF
jgi:hypothetical protein